jgi:hypothetical protein
MKRYLYEISSGYMDDGFFNGIKSGRIKSGVDAQKYYRQRASDLEDQKMQA